MILIHCNLYSTTDCAICQVIYTESDATMRISTINYDSGPQQITMTEQKITTDQDQQELKSAKQQLKDWSSYCHTHTQTHNKTTALPGPLKWSVINVPVCRNFQPGDAGT